MRCCIQPAAAGQREGLGNQKENEVFQAAHLELMALRTCSSWRLCRSSEPMSFTKWVRPCCGKLPVHDSFWSLQAQLASQTGARQQAAPTEISRISNAEKQKGLGRNDPIPPAQPKTAHHCCCLLLVTGGRANPWDDCDSQGEAMGCSSAQGCAWWL